MRDFNNVVPNELKYIVISKFTLHLPNYIHLLAYTLGKRYDLPKPNNGTMTDLLQEWL